MAKGRCINIPKCPLALSKEIQEADKANFVCKHCGKPLMEVQGPPIITDPGDPWKKYKKLIIIGSAAAVLLGGGGIAAYFMSQDKPAVVEPGGDEGKVVLTNWISIMEGKSLTLKVGENKTLSLDCDPGNANEGVIWSSNNEGIATVAMDGTVTAITNGKATITVTTTVKKNTASIEVSVTGSNAKQNTPSPSGESIIDLGFATYKGAVQNGKPHGSGTMTFKQEAVIPGSKGNIKANAGDYAQGEWRNGEVNLVRLHQQGNDPQAITHK
ncbi:MAG: Ig-like domain-containing protein [bacterium]|nr:Ig-like domain-containing protein [bacterium]